MNPELEDLLKAWHIAYDFDLKRDDQVVVAGCYTGKVMELLLNMYPGIFIDGYDMQGWALESARARLATFGSYRLHEYGLGVATQSVKLNEYHTDACSIYRHGSREPGIGELVEYTEALSRRNLDERQLDLLVLNMEGYEFPLLAHMLDTAELPRKLAVQWHLNIGAGNEDDMYALLDDLKEAGYFIVYNHVPQWSYMELNRS